ncbi:RICIN domain-containing protein [Rapidithrix thailandica]|uniref:RICIN domain-containing protein n=1 Tax=Rapidithrix thailandica TaxID=413964 RepID=A0AAW9S6P2_9BACT
MKAKKTSIIALVVLILLFPGGLFCQNYEPYLQKYVHSTVSLNDEKLALLQSKYTLISQNINSLVTQLEADFGYYFSVPEVLIAGGVGTQTAINGLGSSEGSDIDLNILVRKGPFNNQLPLYIWNAENFKKRVMAWLKNYFPEPQYQYAMKDPVIEISSSTVLPSGQTFNYHIDVASFNKINTTQQCTPDCAELAIWSPQTSPSFLMTRSYSFSNDFTSYFQQYQQAFSVAKILKYWNKTLVDSNPDDTPPSIAYLITDKKYYNRNLTPPNITLRNLIEVTDSIQDKVFIDGCSTVQNVHIYVPFYQSSANDVLRKMSNAAKSRFCDSVHHLLLYLDSALAAPSEKQGLQYLSSVLPNFNAFPNGTYTIKNAGSNKYMEILGNSSAWGADLITGSYHGSDNQKFTVEYVGNDLHGDYYKIMAVNSSLYLDVYEGSTASGQKIIQWPYSGSDNQLWYIQYTGLQSSDEVAYTIVSKRSNLYLDGTNQTVVQANYNGTNDNQSWIFNDILSSSKKTLTSYKFAQEHGATDQQIDALNISPNPNTGLFEITVQTNESQQLGIQIVNMMGVEIYKTDRNCIQGTHRIKIDLKNIPSGIYNVVVYTNTDKIAKRIMVAH